jgi:hypothetical protein
MPYIYHLCCPDSGEVRYIGKANDPSVRYRKHLDSAKNPQNYAQRWIAKLARQGKKPILVVAREILEHENWQEVEREAISEGFAKGLRLTNTSAGGEGVLLRDPADEQRRIAAVREAWKCPQVRAAQSARQKVAQNTPEARAANRERMKERWKDPEYAELNARLVKAHYSTPEARKAQSERTLEANKNPTVVEARAKGIKAAWEDPQRKQKWVAALTVAQNTPEAKARAGSQMRQLHKDPAFKEKMRKVMADPDMIRRRNAAISETKQKKRAERLALLPPPPTAEEKAALRKARQQAAWDENRRKALSKTAGRLKAGLTPEVIARRAETLRQTHAKRKAEREEAKAAAQAKQLEESLRIAREWLDQCCTTGGSFRHIRHELYASYCSQDGTPMRDSEFYAWLVTKGFPAKKSSNRFHLGLKLR